MRRHYGDVFALISGNEKVHLINITTEQTLPGEFSLDELGAMRAINKSETILASVNDDTINLWDIQTGENLSACNP